MLTAISPSGNKSLIAIFPFAVRIPTPEFTSVAKSSTFCKSTAVITELLKTELLRFIPEKLFH